MIADILPPPRLEIVIMGAELFIATGFVLAMIGLAFFVLDRRKAD